MRTISAAEHIQQAIAGGEYAPGYKLNESDIASELGISRNTLRESFAALAERGLVTRVPNRGVFISSLTAADGQEVYTVRSVVEPAALMWGEKLDVDELDRIVSEAEQALHADQPKVIADRNQKFHQSIMNSAGSEMMNEKFGDILALMRLMFLKASCTIPEFHSEYVPVNRSIVTALQDGDRFIATELLRNSLLDTRSKIIQLLPEEAVYGAQ